LFGLVLGFEIKLFPAIEAGDSGICQLALFPIRLLHGAAEIVLLIYDGNWS
jgi:hypothetical protein